MEMAENPGEAAAFSWQTTVVMAPLRRVTTLEGLSKPWHYLGISIAITLALPKHYLGITLALPRHSS